MGMELYALLVFLHEFFKRSFALFQGLDKFFKLVQCSIKCFWWGGVGFGIVFAHGAADVLSFIPVFGWLPELSWTTTYFWIIA